MQTKQLHLVFSLLLTLCVCSATQAQQAGRIESMKLLTPEVGWAATNKKLFWTVDGGASWKDITPKADHKGQAVSSVFFLDTSTGWVVLKCGDDRDVLADEGCFALASTTDAGETWSVLQEKIKVPFSREYLGDSTGFSGQSWLQFIDSNHGWELLDIATNSANDSAGEMLRTVDGGKTWVPTKDTPTSDHFLFITTTDGWIAGGKGQELFVTHDAGDSWQKVSLAKPPSVGPDMGVGIGLPVFESERRGFLPVRYAVGPLRGPDLSTVVLFVTEDRGRSWKQDRTLARIPDIYCSDIVGSTLIAVHSELRKEAAETHNGAPQLELSLSALGPGQNVVSNSARVFSYGAPVQLSFVSREQGWANLLDGLFATRDGGRTWLEVTPGGTRPIPSAAISPVKSAPMQMGRGTGARGLAEQPAPGGNVSTHLGFDAYNVPTLSQMTAWSTSSPYYDIAIYLQGSKNGHKDPILGSPNGPGWISTAGGQGWGLIPAWVGVQSPCACYKTNQSTGACTMAYPSVFSSNPGQDGINEAKAAVAAANALGVATPVIYKDIENYYGPTLCTPTQQAAAGAAVQAFVSGWCSQLHSTANGSGNYLAGVYGNPKSAQNDFSQAATVPDDVWVTKTPGTKNGILLPPAVTIWNLAPLTDNPWPSGQRIHQFLMNQQNVTFGAVPLTIDDDIDNAVIANANTLAKTYTYSTPANISCPGAINTYPAAINDMSNGTFINGPGQTGTVVGMVQYSIGSPNCAFQNIGGTCTTFSVLGSTIAEATGINNLGQIVGYFEGTDGRYHGFFQDVGKAPAQIDYIYNGQTAAATYLYGINDAGQMVGYAYSPSTFYFQSFMYYGSQFYPLGYTGNFEYNQARAINGSAVVTGIYYYEPFYEDFTLAEVPSTATPPSWSGPVVAITPGGSANTQALGIDANNELAGYYTSTACNDTSYQCGLMWTGGFLLTILQYGATDNVATGLNDFAQVVGAYTDSTTQYSNGLVWTHQ